MISVSYLKSKYSKEETIKRIDNSNANLIHVDLKDGLYVEGNNFTTKEVINDLKDTIKPIDIHLMAKEPIKYIEDLAKLNPVIITIHVDSTQNLEETLLLIKSYGIKAGIAINPDQDISLIDKYINLVDYILIMSVYPGKGGQSFIPEVLDKVKYVKNNNLLCGIDGGVNDTTIKEINKYNIDIIVSGSFVCMSDDFNKQIEVLKNVIN